MWSHPKFPPISPRTPHFSPSNSPGGSPRSRPFPHCHGAPVTLRSPKIICPRSSRPSPSTLCNIPIPSVAIPTPSVPLLLVRFSSAYPVHIQSHRPSSTRTLLENLDFLDQDLIPPCARPHACKTPNLRRLKSDRIILHSQLIVGVWPPGTFRTLPPMDHHSFYRPH